MLNEMAALSNIGGALSSTPQSLADVYCWKKIEERRKTEITGQKYNVRICYAGRP